MPVTRDDRGRFSSGGGRSGAFHLSFQKADCTRAIARLKADQRTKVRLLLNMAGAQTVAYLRSLTSEMQPPARKPNGGGMTAFRPAHPGHWADITSNLALAYSFEVQDAGNEIRLILRNTMSYAAFLEARDGYFVLSGVTDPGGPLEKALVAAVAKVAPGYRVVVGIA